MDCDVCSKLDSAEMQAFPASRLAALALHIATGQQRDAVVEVHAKDLA